MQRPRASWRAAWQALALATIVSCASSGPRFDPYIQQGLVKEKMRHLETPHVELYYPAPFEEAARHIVSRLERCATVLRGKPRPDENSEKLLVYLTLANFNNAFVQAEYAGSPLQMVLPIHSTIEEQNFLLLGTVNEGNIGCHEATHYVQDQQTHGAWWYANIIAGPLAEPSQGLERWFTEGLAVWNEGHIDLKTGRPNSPFWHGMYEAAMTTRGNKPRWGDMDLNTRDLYMTGAYLTSSHFIDYLTRHYGESKLWDLIDREAGTIVPDVGIALLFRAVYGKTLMTLIDDYGREMAETPIRERPPSQKVLVSDAGGFARIAVSPADGSIAEISSGYDYPLRLAIRDSNGRMKLNLPLTRFLPGRDWINLGAEGVSGLRFSNDGRLIFFVGDVLAMDGDDATILVGMETATGKVIGKWDLQGYGGDLTPDGGYIYVDVQGDTENLVKLDLVSSRREKLTDFEPARSIGAPAVSQDGKRIAFSLWNGANFDLAMRYSDGHIEMLTQDARTNYGPKWIDDDHLLFMRELNGHWQAHIYDLTTRTIEPITQAPYLAFDAAPTPEGNVVFLNRSGVQFTIDEVPLSTPGSSGDTGVPAASPPPMPPEASPTTVITGDRPAGGGEQVMPPLLHVPFIQIEPTQKWPWGLAAGATFSGSDRLGIHNYYLMGYYDTLTKQPSFEAAYYFNGVSPNLFTADVSRTVGIGWDNRQASLMYSRTFWDVPLQIGFLGQEQIDATSKPPFWVVGPAAAMSYNAYETTPYAGVRRSIRFGLSGAVYPTLFGSSFSIGEVRPTLGFTVPLPFSPRHTLSFDAVGNLVLGSQSVLAVGGESPGTTLLSTYKGVGGTGSSANFQLGEYVQGYEDHVNYTSRVVIGAAHYQYPFIIDRGMASFLWVLPSVFVSEVDLNLFGTDALLDSGSMRAAGGTVTLVTVWGQAVPITLTYQFAYRWDDGLNTHPLQMLWFGL